MPTVQIVPKFVDPDELMIKQGSVFVYTARVVHSLRSVSGQSFKTASNEYIGTVESA